MPEADLPLLITAAHAAGEIAMRHFAGDRAATEKPDAQGPVTEADLEVDRMLRDRLLAARPDYGWLSEESENDPARLDAERVFIVDPIDGTRAFVEGGKAWSHALAVAERGRVVAGVVFLPRLERTYSAAAGEGAVCNGEPIRVSRREVLTGAKVLVNATQLDPKFWPSGVPAIERHFRSSLAYRMCLAAEGRYDAMLTFRDAWEWDIAAGDLIAREAGGRVTDRLGHAPVFNNPRPALPGVIAAPPELHARLLAQTRPAPG
ncbi:MAG: 3'(2'),5'-bisphosphate nucleotidase CysQ [Rhodobacteraceae bacterium]|nr:3'(2'),5'-bisphosphate nucleotidase CysQ [Paracoccaceae bacterium]